MVTLTIKAQTKQEVVQKMLDNGMLSVNKITEFEEALLEFDTLTKYEFLKGISLVTDEEYVEAPVHEAYGNEIYDSLKVEAENTQLRNDLKVFVNQIICKII